MSESNERTVIVTGGTGALGQAVVSAFLDSGDRVVVPWIVEAEAEAMPSHPDLVLMEADVSEPAGAAAVAEAAGSAAALVNGVGGFAGGDPLHVAGVDTWDRLYRMNVRTAVCMSAAVIPGMRSAGEGAIVSVASQAAIDCPAGLGAYSASKAAIIALTRTLSAENRSEGLRVNAVVPTTIDTPANRSAMPDADFEAWTPPTEIARVAHWLCSPAARTVSGGLIPV